MTEPEFRKTFFPAKNAGNMPEKPVFGIFSRFHHYFFLIFCTKTRISNTHNMTGSDFWEIFFSGRKHRKYDGNRRFCRFSLDFFLIFHCFFTQNIININAHHQFYVSIVNKIYFGSRNSRFSPEKRYFLNFSSCTLYVFMKFCTVMPNANTY